MPVIETNNLVKQYGSSVRALKGVSLQVESGEIFGLLGQNGAGKTTLVKILLGILSPTEGSARLLGQPCGTVAVRSRVGYLPEDHRFPDYHTGASLLDFYGSLLGMSSAARRERIPKVLEMVGISGRAYAKIRTYSKGMKQRLGIAQALLHHPEVVFLDEPTDGVDPVGRREIRELLQDLKAKGVTVFVNSHLLGEVELLCDRVIILDRGSVVRQGTIAELTRRRGTFTVGLAEGDSLPVEMLQQRGYRVQRSGLHWELDLPEGQSIDEVVRLLLDQGLRLRHLVEKRQTLEDLFVQTVEAAEPGVDRRQRQSVAPLRAQEYRA